MRNSDVPLDCAQRYRESVSDDEPFALAERNRDQSAPATGTGPLSIRKLQIRRQRESPFDGSILRAFSLAEERQASLYLQCKLVQRCSPSRLPDQPVQPLYQ